MSLETGSYISALVSTNPAASDPKSQGDDHIRFLKGKILETFPNITGAVTPTHTELNYVDGVTSAIQTQLDAKSPSASPTFTGTVVLPSTTSIGTVSNTEISYLDGVTSAIQTQIDSKSPSASPTFTGTVVLPSTTSIGTVSNTEISYLDGVTSAIQTQLDAKSPSASPTFTGTVVLPSTTSVGNVSSTELSYLDGVTSAIQTQLDAKAALNSPALTGTPTAPTAGTGTSTTQIATTAFVMTAAFNTALPSQTGNSGKYVTTDGTNASWGTPGDVTGQSSSVDNELALFSGTGGKTIKRATTTGVLKATSGVIAAAVAGTDYVSPVGSDGQLTRQMLIDCGYTVVDKGNSGTSTQTYDYTAGSLQTSTATGNHTIAFSNWPPTGNLGVMQIILTNGGAYTLTWPGAILWIKPDGTTTSSISTYLAALTGRTALQTSGVDQFVFWTRDAGTTVYGKLI